MDAASPRQENVVGTLALLRYKLTDYNLIFTDRRIIAFKTGAAPVAELAALIDGASGRMKIHLPVGLTYPSDMFDRILAAHPKNFQVMYEDVDRGLFNAGISGLTMPMLKLWMKERYVFFAFMKSALWKDKNQIRLAKEILTRTLSTKIEMKHV